VTVLVPGTKDPPFMVQSPVTWTSLPPALKDPLVNTASPTLEATVVPMSVTVAPLTVNPALKPREGMNRKRLINRLF
jgi:hypothetical protein